MSGLIQGADKWICLSPTSKVFLSVICTIKARGKKPRVWKGPAENRENSGDTVFRGRSTLGSQTEGFGHWHITAQLQQQLLLPSWAEEVLGWPGTAFPTALLLLLPTQGKGRGDTCSQLRGGIRRCSSLWGCSLPWEGRQPISGSENLGRVLFQNVYNTFF